MSGEKEQTIEERMQEAEQSLRHIEWEERKIPLEMITEVADNIRPRDEEHVQALADSISEIGQLQPCLCDPVPNDGIRLVAGNHRKFAVEELCKRGEPTCLTVRIANRMLTPVEVLCVQMSENLHKEMSPSEDAVIIHGIWKEACKVYGEEVSFVYIGRKLGRSAERVSRAIKFIREVSPSVQMLVDNGKLPYSIALALRNIPQRSEDEYWGEQLRLALFFVLKRYSANQAKDYIDRLRSETDYTGTLFGNDVWESTKVPLNKVVKIKADEEGIEAVNWFTNIQSLIALLPEGKRAEFTEAVENAFKNMHGSFEEFMSSVQGYVPESQMKHILNND